MAKEVLICSKDELAQAARSNGFGTLSKTGEFKFNVVRTTSNANGKFVVLSALVDNTVEIVTLRLGNIRDFALNVPKLLIEKGDEVYMNCMDFLINANPRIIGFRSNKKEVKAEETV
jgi:hypothetical protein